MQLYTLRVHNCAESVIHYTGRACALYNSKHYTLRVHCLDTYAQDEPVHKCDELRARVQKSRRRHATHDGEEQRPLPLVNKWPPTSAHLLAFVQSAEFLSAQSLDG